MKNKISLAAIVVPALAVLLTFGCGTSPKTASTSAPKATSLPAATSTPKPLPDFSKVRVSLDELPAGFKEIATDDILAKQKASGKEAYLPDGMFAFVNTDKFQVIFGMNYLLSSATKSLAFSGFLKHSDSTLKDFAGALGGKNIREEKVLEGLETLGEKQAALTMLADLEDIPMRVEGVLFKRDNIGSLILTMSMEGESPNISLQELGTLLDQHIQESLSAAE